MTARADTPPLVVVGGSAGSIGPLRAQVAARGSGFSGAVCIVAHLSRCNTGVTPGQELREGIPVVSYDHGWATRVGPG